MTVLPLTDDELESLLASVHRSPRSDTVRAVGRGLLRRKRFAEAADVLTTSLRTFDDPRIWSLLAHACLGATRLQQALTALHNVDCDPAANHKNARLLVLVLERLRRTNEAKALARRILEHHPDERVTIEALARLEAEPHVPPPSAADPFYNVDRAEQYVAIGRVDRAIRIYRRIQLQHPDHADLAARIRELQAQVRSATPDLAEQLPPPGLVSLPRLPPSTLLADDDHVDDSEDAPTVHMDSPDEVGPFRRWPVGDA